MLNIDFDKICKLYSDEWNYQHNIIHNVIDKNDVRRYDVYELFNSLVLNKHGCKNVRKVKVWQDNFVCSEFSKQVNTS